SIGLTRSQSHSIALKRECPAVSWNWKWFSCRRSNRMVGWKKNRPGEPTMRKYKRQIEQAKEKAANRERLSLEAQLPMSELIAGVRQDIEGFAAELGLTIIQ